MTQTRSRIFVGAALVLGLGLSACSADEQNNEETTSPAETTEAAPEATSDDADDTVADETEEAEADETETDETDEAEAAGPVEVTVVSDQGVVALTHDGNLPDGKAGPTAGRLVTGPGDCFAITSDGPAVLVVFPDDAEFVLEDSRPSVTLDGTEHYVGELFGVETVELSASDFTGIPERCQHGQAADKVLVVE